MTKTNAETIARIIARQKANLAAGLCRCGRKRNGIGKRCDSCSAVNVRCVEIWQQRNVEAGRCRCGRKRVPKRKHCEVCLQKARQRWRQKNYAK